MHVADSETACATATIWLLVQCLVGGLAVDFAEEHRVATAKGVIRDGFGARRIL